MRRINRLILTQSPFGDGSAERHGLIKMPNSAPSQHKMMLVWSSASEASDERVIWTTETFLTVHGLQEKLGAILAFSPGSSFEKLHLGPLARPLLHKLCNSGTTVSLRAECTEKHPPPPSLFNTHAHIQVPLWLCVCVHMHDWHTNTHTHTTLFLVSLAGSYPICSPGGRTQR